MHMIRFNWDENKNSINKKQHGISFEEASSVFYDDNALVIDDPDHSIEEDRFIISARKATSAESEQYWR